MVFGHWRKTWKDSAPIYLINALVGIRLHGKDQLLRLDVNTIDVQQEPYMADLRELVCVIHQLCLYAMFHTKEGIRII